MKQTEILYKSGHKFGKRTYLGEAKYQGKNIVLKCQCECDRIQWVRYSSLRYGQAYSCWWCNDTMKTIKHGLSFDPTWIRWASIKSQCRSKKANNYSSKNIKVCKRWLKFENFLEDMGPVPEGHWLIRLDKSKGFGPENCVWQLQKKYIKKKYEDKPQVG